MQSKNITTFPGWSYPCQIIWKNNIPGDIVSTTKATGFSPLVKPLGWKVFPPVHMHKTGLSNHLCSSVHQFVHKYHSNKARWFSQPWLSGRALTAQARTLGLIPGVVLTFPFTSSYWTVSLILQVVVQTKPGDLVSFTTPTRHTHNVKFVS